MPFCSGWWSRFEIVVFRLERARHEMSSYTTCVVVTYAYRDLVYLRRDIFRSQWTLVSLLDIFITVYRVQGQPLFGWLVWTRRTVRHCKLVEHTLLLYAQRVCQSYWISNKYMPYDITCIFIISLILSLDPGAITFLSYVMAHSFWSFVHSVEWFYSLVKSFKTDVQNLKKKNSDTHKSHF